MQQRQNKVYRNLFVEAGFEKEAVEKRLEEIRQFYFYGGETERVYFPVGDDMAYICDTGNNDARTEGMSSPTGKYTRSSSVP